MLACIDSKKLLEWRAFNQLEPFGDARADFRIGQLTAILANALRQKGQKSYKWSDFTPDAERSGMVRGDENMLAHMKSIVAAYGDTKPGDKK